MTKTINDSKNPFKRYEPFDDVNGQIVDKLNVLNNYEYNGFSISYLTTYWNKKETKSLAFRYDADIQNTLSKFPILSIKDVQVKIYNGEPINHSVERPTDSGTSIRFHNDTYGAMVYVNIHNIPTLIHELGHIIDALSNDSLDSIPWSEQDAFKPFIDSYIESFLALDNIEEYDQNTLDYYFQPTEVYARLFQIWYNDINEPNTITTMKYIDDSEQLALDLYNTDIKEYFKETLPEIYRMSDEYDYVSTVENLDDTTIIL